MSHVAIETLWIDVEWVRPMNGGNPTAVFAGVRADVCVALGGIRSQGEVQLTDDEQLTIYEVITRIAERIEADIVDSLADVEDEL